jgi:hypothetical protein
LPSEANPTALSGLPPPELLLQWRILDGKLLLLQYIVDAAKFSIVRSY